MKLSQKILLFFVTTVSLHLFVYAQGYNSIIPLHSTCLDVERILKIKACSEKEPKYKTENETVEFYISTKNCVSLFTGKYNAPVGTVLVVGIQYQPLIPKQQFPIDFSKFEKHPNDYSIWFQSKEQGLEIKTDLFEDKVVEVWYYPTKKDATLLCKIQENNLKKKVIKKKKNYK